MISQPIEKLSEIFSKFPGIGKRTANRFVFYLLKLSNKEVNELLKAIIDVRKQIKTCNFCFLPFDTSLSKNEKQLCPICQNPARDKKLLCIVEKEIDLLTIEKTKLYKGLYFILGSTFNPKKEKQDLRIKELKERIKNPKKFGIEANFQEIILAFNPTTEGEITSLYLERELKPLNIKISRLGRGLPIGGEIEYADEETLKSALEGRK